MEIPQWIIIGVPIASAILAIGGAWAVIKYRQDAIEKRIDELEDDMSKRIDKLETSQELSSSKLSEVGETLKELATNVKWIVKALETKKS